MRNIDTWYFGFDDDNTVGYKYFDGLVQERHNSIASTLSYIFLALTHRYSLDHIGPLEHQMMPRHGNTFRIIGPTVRGTPLTNGPLRWRHNGHDSVSNHQPHDCLLKRLFRRRSKKTSKLRVTGLCAGNSPGTGEFPAQMATNAGNVSIWWRHHAVMWCFDVLFLGDIYMYIYVCVYV